MNFKNILFFILFYSAGLVLTAQNNNKEENERIRKLPFKERLTFMMGGGAFFGNNYSSINLLPQVGYRINARLTSGIGANFQYTKNFNTSFIAYGGNLFTRYQVTDNLFAQVQYEVLNYTYLANQGWNDYLMIGGGYSTGTGIYISGYYLLKYPARNNIYGAPYVIRVGMAF
jgi:hypothetical protein